MNEILNLRADLTFIRLLGRLLGEVIREQHWPEAYQLVEDIHRQVVGEYRADALEPTMDRLRALSQADILLLIRAFSIFSQLTNIADDHVLRHETKALGSSAAQYMELSSRPHAQAGARLSAGRAVRAGHHRPSHRLAKSRLPIARRHAELAQDSPLAEKITAQIKTEWRLTRDAVLAVSGQSELLSNNPRLAETIQSRLPYVDLLNHLQVDLLRRHRH
jgi:phosphoenolpyruvate carboxylase